MKEETKIIDYRLVGKESLVYHPSKVSWSISEHISRENPLLERALVYTLCSMFFLVLIYTLVAKVAISTKTSGKLEYESPSVVLINENDITVDRLFYKNNQAIKKDSLILQAKGQLSVASLIKLKKSRDDIMKLVALDEGEKCTSTCVRQLEALSETAFSFQQNLSSKGTFKDYLQRLTTDLKNYMVSLQARQNLESSTSGLKNQIATTRQKIKKIEINRSQEILRMEYNQLKSELINLQSQLKEKSSSIESNITQNRNTFKVTINNLDSSIGDYVDGNQLKAPTDGVLVYMDKITEGQFIGARSKLFQVIPVSENLMAKSLISNKDISMIKKDQKVKISIDALPEREYSSAWGTVESIGIEPVEDPATKEMKYEIMVKLDRQSLNDYKGISQNFKLGMTFQAQIITDYKSLFRVMVSKLLNIKDEYLGDYL